MNRPYQSAAEEHNGEAFAGTFTLFSSAGLIQQDGKDFISVADDMMEPKKAEKVGKELLRFCKQAHRLHVDDYGGHDGVPRIFLTIDEDELKDQSIALTVINVEVKMKDGKAARVSLAVGKNDLNGLYATVTTTTANTNPQKTVKLHGVDWEKRT